MNKRIVCVMPDLLGRMADSAKDVKLENTRFLLGNRPAACVCQANIPPPLRPRAMCAWNARSFPTPSRQVAYAPTVPAMWDRLDPMADLVSTVSQESTKTWAANRSVSAVRLEPFRQWLVPAVPACVRSAERTHTPLKPAITLPIVPATLVRADQTEDRAQNALRVNTRSIQGMPSALHVCRGSFRWKSVPTQIRARRVRQTRIRPLPAPKTRTALAI